MRRLEFRKVKFDVCGMVTIDKTLLSSVKNSSIKINNQFDTGDFNILHSTFFIFFAGSDQRNFIFSYCSTVQLQLSIEN